MRKWRSCSLQFARHALLHSPEAHSELVEPFDVRTDADKIPLDVRFLFPPHRKSSEAKHFFHDPEDRLNGVFAQFVECFAGRCVKPVCHDFSDACSG